MEIFEVAKYMNDAVSDACVTKNINYSLEIINNKFLEVRGDSDKYDIANIQDFKKKYNITEELENRPNEAKFVSFGIDIIFGAERFENNYNYSEYIYFYNENKDLVKTLCNRSVYAHSIEECLQKIQAGDAIINAQSVYNAIKNEE